MAEMSAQEWFDREAAAAKELSQAAVAYATKAPVDKSKFADNWDRLLRAAEDYVEARS